MHSATDLQKSTELQPPEGGLLYSEESTMFRLILLMTLLLCCSCSGMQPYRPVNHREEGPPGGILTGPAGEWSISPGASGTKPGQSW